MPSVVRPSSSDFPVFAPVRRRSGGVGAVSATPLPPSADFPHFSLGRYPLGKTAGLSRKILVPPLFGRFSPFLTVFPIVSNRYSPSDSRARPFFDTPRAVKKRRKRGKRLELALPFDRSLPCVL